MSSLDYIVMVRSAEQEPVMGALAESLRAEPVQMTNRTLRERALVPVLVYIGMLVAVISSLGSPLVPTIAADYGVSFGTAQWSLTITLLVGAVSSPIIGRLGEGPHRLAVLLSALVLTVAGSVLSALPGTVFGLLLAGRGLQGIGLALLPLVMSVARDHLAPDAARTALATLSVTSVVGVGLGYPLSGLVAEHFSFHAGFWIAAGLGTVAVVLVLLTVPPSDHQRRHAFDTRGAVLFASGLGALLVAISEGEDWGWLSLPLGLVAIAAVVLLAAWVWHELRTNDPLVTLRQLRHPTVLSASVVALLAGVSVYTLMAMIIRYVQTPTSISYGLGASVVVAGLLLTPFSATTFLASKLINRLPRAVDPSRVLPFGALLLLVSVTLFTTARGQLWDLAVQMGIAGLAVGSMFAVVPRLIMSAVPREETSSALAFNQVLRMIGFSVGSALAGTVLTAHTAAHSRFPTDHGYTVGGFIAIALGILTAVVSWVLPRRAASAKSPVPSSGSGERLPNH